MAAGIVATIAVQRVVGRKNAENDGEWNVGIMEWWGRPRAEGYFLEGQAAPKAGGSTAW
jgi:hypothetical protein